MRRTSIIIGMALAHPSARATIRPALSLQGPCRGTELVKRTGDLAAIARAGISAKPTAKTTRLKDYQLTRISQGA
jgi:hypothetical protein